jgi:tetratricopeptide (TPR) repeat protein
MLRVQWSQRSKLSWLVPAGVAFWVIMLSVTTVYRNEYWRTHVLLWADSAAKSPLKARPWANLASALANEGNPVMALMCVGHVFELKSREGSVYCIKAGALGQLKKYEEVIKVCDEGLAVAGSQQPLLLFNRAVACWALNRKEEAVNSLQLAELYSPMLPYVHLYLARYYAELEQLNEADVEYHIAESLDPKCERLAETRGLIQSKQQMVSAN